MRGFAAAAGRRLAWFVRPHMVTSKWLQLSIVALLGLFAGRAYYQWLLHSGTHKAALHSFGLPGYWTLLAVPAAVVFVPLCIVALRHPSYSARWVIAGAVAAAVVIAYLGHFGDFLVCVFVSRGVCE